MMIVKCWMWLNKLGWLMQLGRCVKTWIIPCLPGGSRLCKQVKQSEHAQLRCMINKNSPRTFSTHIYTHTHMISRTHLHTGRDAVTEMNKSTFAHTQARTRAQERMCNHIHTRLHADKYANAPLCNLDEIQAASKYSIYLGNSPVHNKEPKMYPMEMLDKRHAFATPLNPGVHDCNHMDHYTTSKQIKNFYKHHILHLFNHCTNLANKRDCSFEC